MTDFWDEQGRRGAETASIDGREIRKGSRVRLSPRARGDVFDLALAGRTAVVEAIEEDAEGRIHVAVTLDDDPGRDLGEARFPGHRFFFAVDEVEPIDDAPMPGPAAPRVLVAGIGNIFLGDDGFGPEVMRHMPPHPTEPRVRVMDYGIRGMHLAYDLLDDWDALWALLTLITARKCGRWIDFFHAERRDVRMEDPARVGEVVDVAALARGGEGGEHQLVPTAPEAARQVQLEPVQPMLEREAAAYVVRLEEHEKGAAPA